MGTTANALPYPDGTDLVMDGDDAIRALAEALKICTGGGSIPSGTGTRNVTMTFPAGLYTTAPWVATSQTNPYIGVGIQALSATGFTAACVWTISGEPMPTGHIARFIAARIG